MSGKFRVVAPMGVTIPEGTILDLTPDQAGARAHNLHATDTGFLVKGPVMFKRGEVIGIPKGELSKLFLGNVEEVAEDGSLIEPVRKTKRK